jgi:hypothetical protein
MIKKTEELDIFSRRYKNDFSILLRSDLRMKTRGAVIQSEQVDSVIPKIQDLQMRDQQP